MESTMTEEVCMRVQKACKELQMITAQAQGMLREMVGPFRDRQRRLEQIARHFGWAYSRTFNIFYGRAKRIDAHEWVRLNEEFLALRESARERQGALHELEILARSAAQKNREVARPESVDSRPQGEATARNGHLHRR
jgi:hypothetical protein